MLSTTCCNVVLHPLSDLYIFRVAQLIVLIILLLLPGIVLAMLLILWLVDTIWEHWNEIFDDLEIRTPSQHDGKNKSIKH